MERAFTIPRCRHYEANDIDYLILNAPYSGTVRVRLARRNYYVQWVCYVNWSVISALRSLSTGRRGVWILKALYYIYKNPIYSIVLYTNHTAL
ncbi:hypothetical protein N7524_004456 [Penicillium chrysogenum]|nr:hypothetical protein N7524_004456 [Penicillium chrysogenum]